MVQKLAKCPFTYLPGKNSLEVIKGREWKINCFGHVKTSNLNISHFLMAKHVREMYFNKCGKCRHDYFSCFWRSNFLHVTDHPREKLPPGRFYGVVISFALWSTQKLGTGAILKWIHQKKVFLFYACFVVKRGNFHIDAQQSWVKVRAARAARTLLTCYRQFFCDDINSVSP